MDLTPEEAERQRQQGGTGDITASELLRRKRISEAWKCRREAEPTTRWHYCPRCGLELT